MSDAKAPKEHHALPKEGRNPMAAGGVVLTHVVCTAFAFALTWVGAEHRLDALLPQGIDERFAQVAIVAASALCMGVLGGFVNRARHRYNVHWPFLMLPKGADHAIEYNAVQRAHGNFLEAVVVNVPLTLAVAHFSPKLVFVLSQLWIWLKFGMAVSYANNGHGKAPPVLLFSYLAVFILYGLAYLALLTALGVVA
eukprot:CAMPEP_0195526604 /NCGR_PEP_ID=MMETSP0794_2-20130614/27765_1 /TAXON_ID=515487 /ORGANISM="Stephanopyxis turris, Strain CCMP 815" /LENGTH=195 /DNA_ID=CAMNT_0040657335 /DNA_START=98 /DNA_END=685 /DNA_ORIENTATION=-